MVNQPVVDTGVKTFTKLFFAHFTAQDVDLLPTQRRFLDKRLQETTPLPLHGVVTGAERAVGAVVRGRGRWPREPFRRCEPRGQVTSLRSARAIQGGPALLQAPPPRTRNIGAWFGTRPTFLIPTPID